MIHFRTTASSLFRLPLSLFTQQVARVWQVRSLFRLCRPRIAPSLAAIAQLVTSTLAWDGAFSPHNKNNKMQNGRNCFGTQIADLLSLSSTSAGGVEPACVKQRQQDWLRPAINIPRKLWGLVFLKRSPDSEIN